jgi:hypothetical protein
VYNAAERKDVRRAEKEAKLAETNRREIINYIMSTNPSRAWMHDVLEACHVFRSSFSADSLQMAFAEGERNVGLRMLVDIMTICPDQYILMMREENVRQATREAKRVNQEQVVEDEIENADQTV